MEEVAGIAIIPVVVGLVEVAKRAGLPAAWAPAVAIATGLALSVGLAVSGASELTLALLRGVVWGLAASGLYAGARTVARSG
jgi:hypothetical protein